MSSKGIDHSKFKINFSVKIFGMQIFWISSALLFISITQTWGRVDILQKDTVGVFKVFYVEDHVICSQWEFYFLSSNLDSLYFSSLIAVAKTSKTNLNSSGESGHPCLVPDFRGNAFNFLSLRIMFALGLSYMAFVMLRYVPSMPAFWRVFLFLS